MPRIYSVRLGATRPAVANQFQLLFTAGPDRTTVIRDLVATADGPAAATVVFEIHVATMALRLWEITIQAGTSAHLDLRQVIEPGESLHVLASVVPAVSVLVSGYEFIQA